VANLDIRERAIRAGIIQWKIADALKIRENNYSRMLRHELPPEKKQQIFEIIDRLEAEKEQEIG
jgi:hypothetical protein